MIHLNVDRVKTFLAKRPSGAKRVMMAIETGTSTTPTPCGEWDREDIEDEQDPVLGHEKMANTIVEAGQEAADSAGEPCKAMLAWVTDSGRPLRTVQMRVMPDDESNDAVEVAEQGGGNSIDTNRLVDSLLSSLTAAYKAQNAATGITLQAYERALNMQQRMIDTLAARLGENLALPAPSGDTTEVQQLKAKALEKLVELGPSVGQLALKALAASLTPSVPTPPVPPIPGAS